MILIPCLFPFNPFFPHYSPYFPDLFSISPSLSHMFFFLKKNQLLSHFSETSQVSLQTLMRYSLIILWNQNLSPMSYDLSAHAYDPHHLIAMASLAEVFWCILASPYDGLSPRRSVMLSWNLKSWGLWSVQDHEGESYMSV